MQNALNKTREKDNSFFVVGPVGTGKTTQVLTLIGKKFAYFFDPNGARAIYGHDVDYEEFLLTKMNFTMEAIKRGGAGGQSTVQKGADRIKAQAFAAWEASFLAKLDEGFFDPYDVIILDSVTTLIDAMLYDIAGREGRLGQVPELSDYRVAGEQLRRILHSFNGLCSMSGKTLYVVGHTMLRSNDDLGTTKILNEILVPGQTQVRGALLFGSVLLAGYELKKEAGTNKESYVFTMQSKRDRHNEQLKSDLPGMPPILDVTIKDLSNPTKFGLGAFVRRLTSGDSAQTQTKE